MSFKSALHSPVYIICKVLLFVQLRILHVRVHFGVVDDLAVLLQFGTSFIDSAVNGIFPMERRIVPIPSRPVVIISEYMPLSGVLVVLQSNLEAETIIDDRQYSSERTPLSTVVKCVAVLLDAERPVSVPTSCARLIYSAPHPNLARN